MCLHASNLELTFTRLGAHHPRVFNLSVASTSTLPIPSTARSTTTDSAGFLERAAFWARRRRRGVGWRESWHANYEFPF